MEAENARMCLHCKAKIPVPARISISHKLTMEIFSACLPVNTRSMGKCRVANTLGSKLLEVILYPPTFFEIIAFCSQGESGPSL
jgi:hypothetical protein